MKSLIEKLKHYFIPHEGNDFKAHIFREGSLGLLLALIVGSFLLGLLHQIVLTNTNYLANIYSGVLVDLANEDRKDNALSELAINPTLEAAARMKAEDMAEKGYFAHYGPDGSAPWDWMKKAGYQFIYAGENLAIDFTDSEDVNQAWLNSPTHRANIMNSKFTEIGIATVKGFYNGRQTIYVVQMFGTPQNQSISLPLTTSPVPVSQLAQSNVPSQSPQVEGASSQISEPKPTQSAQTKPAPKTVAKVTQEPAQVKTIATSSNETESSKETFIAVENVSSTPVIGQTENTNVRNDSSLIRMIRKVETNPIKVVETVFAFIGLLVMVGLVGVIVKDLETHHLRHAMGGVLLMVIIVTLAYIYKVFVFSSAVIVALN